MEFRNSCLVRIFFHLRIGANVVCCGCEFFIENQISHHINNHNTYTKLIKENKIIMQWRCFGLSWKRVMKWDYIGGRSFLRNWILTPHIGNPFPALARKMLTRQESVFVESFRTKRMENSFFCRKPIIFM